MSTSSSNVENFSPQVIRQVSKELHELVLHPLEGIKVIINEEDITDIQATIEGPACTPYNGGLFKVRCVLGKDFPAQPPKAYFITKVFHPNVSRNGEICVNTLKKDWKPDLGVKHILLTIKCLLIVPNAESALNEEAGKLLLEHYDDYCKRAKMMTEIHARVPKDVATLEHRKDSQMTSSSAAEPHSSNSSNVTNTNTVISKQVTNGTGSASTTTEQPAAVPVKKPKKIVLSKDRKKALKRL